MTKSLIMNKLTNGGNDGGETFERGVGQNNNNTVAIEECERSIEVSSDDERVAGNHDELNKDLEKDDTSSVGGETTSNDGDFHHVESKTEVIGEEETRLVNLSKLLVAIVVVFFAIIMGILTYTLLRNQQSKDYQSEFDEIASEIISVTHIRSKAVFDNLESVGASFTAQARAMNAEFPMLVFPDFQVQGMISNQMTGANTLTIHPLVKDDEREAWESFAVANQGWIAEGHLYDEIVHPSLYERDFFNDSSVEHDESLRWHLTGIIPRIWTTDDNGQVRLLPNGSSDVYAPFWQRAPEADFSPFVNQDLHSIETFKGVIDAMLETDHPVMTEVTDAVYLRDSYDQRFAPEEKETPHIYLLSPVYDNFTVNRTAVAFLSALFRFDNFFTNVLPESEVAIVVLEGSCGQTFTYKIIGHKTKYIGADNFGDVKYEHLRKEFDIAPFAVLEETENKTYCQYKARIYPSPELEERFFTNEPIYYATAVVACFVVTSFVFTLYDVLVQRRQKKVLDSATKTHAIVSSLYPATVRDRLMEEMKANEERRKAQEKRSQLSEFKSSLTSSPNHSPKCETSEAIFGSKPIADVFEHTTIMFADLVGFTAWSSSREPQQVFTLLETIYFCYDTIAKRRRVFKVETVGDCYVAVVGLPVPRDDHAVVMARFAHECRLKMNRLVRQLEDVLGEGTANLAMRMGLHSGPVTAGVLRGDKGRFQLFGDSMNTAARIESTGVRDRIHLSQTTANLLIQAGKEKWVVAREDKVVAKGLGELTTYFLQIKPVTSDEGGSSIAGDGTTVGDDDGEQSSS